MASPEQFGMALGGVLADALMRVTREAQAADLIRPDQQARLGEVEVYSWPQAWPSTALDRGIGGQAITSAQTVVVAALSGAYVPAAYVYHGWRFAKRLSLATGEQRDRFWAGVRQQNLR